jgi:hypothetical protein
MRAFGTLSPRCTRVVPRHSPWWGDVRGGNRAHLESSCTRDRGGTRRNPGPCGRHGTGRGGVASTGDDRVQRDVQSRWSQLRGLHRQRTRCRPWPDLQNGTFVDTGISFAGYQSNRGTVQLQVLKEFTCPGSGTFRVKLQIQANFNSGIESFTWVVQDGTGAYAALRGSGNGSTVPTSSGNTNTYDGFLIH